MTKKTPKKSPLLENYIPEEMVIAAQCSNFRDEHCCGTIFSNIKKLMSNVHEGVVDTLKINGYNSVFDLEDEKFLPFCFWYVIGMLDIFCHTGIPYIIKELRKPKVNYTETYKLDKHVQENDKNEVVSRALRKREESNTLKDKYNPNKEERANTINNLRKYLYSNKFTLKGTYLDTEHVTFFDFNIHESLKLIFPNEIEISDNSSYIKLKNVEELEKKLKNLLQVEVKIAIA